MCRWTAAGTFSPCRRRMKRFAWPPAEMRNSRITLTFRSKSGQALLVAILVTTILLLCIPVIILLQRTAASHQVGSQLRLKGREIAETGISYAIRELSINAETW